MKRNVLSWILGGVLVSVLPNCDGITLPDQDGDGIPDLIDPCPTNPDPTCMPTPPPAEAYDCANPPALTGMVKVRGAIKDRYIVVLKRGIGARSRALVQSVANRLALKDVQPFARVLEGFAAKIEPKKLLSVLMDPDVQYVQQEGRKKAIGLSWGLDRIDARAGLDGKFSPLLSGTNIHIYVNDTGVSPNPDLGSRLSPDCFSTIGGCEDGHGHGTHVAGTAAGTTWGVAKGAIVHSARFLDQNGSGSDTDAIRTLEWIQAHDPGPGTRKVVNASWGGSPAPALDAAVCRLIESGTVFVAAAGNESTDSRNSTPSRVVQAITVGAMDRNDGMASFSNYGPGVDLFAPGVDIESDTPGGGTTTMSGTSMATPHVVGGAALYLELHRSATPAEVEAGLISESTPDKLSGVPAETPNRLLYVTPTGEAPPPGGTPPKGIPVGADRLLKTNGATVVDQAGKRVDLFQAIACCRTPIVPEGAKATVRRPRPVRVAGVEINARWPLASPEWMDFTHAYLADAWHFRMGPFYADEETESDWMDIGGPYLPGGLDWNQAFWQAARDYAYHAYKLGGRVEVVAIDTWGCKYSQAGNRYVPWPADAIEACGRTWHPEHERFARKVVEELGCFGNTYWAVDNEGEGIQGENAEWFLQLRNVIRDEEQRTGCGFVHPIGTSVRAVMPGVDYSITHVREALLEPIAGHWTVNNERNPAGAPDQEEAYFRQARSSGLVWALWRDDMEDGAFYDTLRRFKRVVEGGSPPPLPTCTLGTPTARQMAAAGKQPTIKVQRTVAGAGLDPQAGKWISGTPVAAFGSVYYCQPGMNWPEACANPPSPGPVAPEGHPQRIACEAQFLEQPCPTFSMARCTGTGEQCPVTWDTYIVIDGVNQLHPDNVKAGCRESTYVKDPDGRLLSGEWWKATAHGKGYLKACNFDGSVCGVSTFEIDQ